jgi:uncharacterized protein
VTLLGAVLALVVGLTLGLLGGGGSILTVPVLVYALGIPAKPAIAMSLPVVGITSLVGAAVHWRRQTIRLRAAVQFGLIAMAGAFVGARVATLLSGAVQLVILAVVMLMAAVAMLRPARATPTESHKPMQLALVALGVGVLTGIVGIGGGFLVVPALVLLAGVPMREAAGTSLLVIAMNAASGFVGHLGEQALDWRLLLQFAMLTVVGTVVGIAAAARVPQQQLRRAFAVLLVGMGAFILFQNRAVLAPARAAVEPTTAPR